MRSEHLSSRPPAVTRSSLTITRLNLSRRLLYRRLQRPYRRLQRLYRRLQRLYRRGSRRSRRRRRSVANIPVRCSQRLSGAFHVAESRTPSDMMVALSLLHGAHRDEPRAGRRMTSR
jgi:hypothetical protein